MSRSLRTAVVCACVAGLLVDPVMACHTFGRYWGYSQSCAPSCSPTIIVYSNSCGYPSSCETSSCDDSRCSSCSSGRSYGSSTPYSTSQSSNGRQTLEPAPEGYPSLVAPTDPMSRGKAPSNVAKPAPAEADVFPFEMETEEEVVPELEPADEPFFAPSNDRPIPPQAEEDEFDLFSPQTESDDGLFDSEPAIGPMAAEPMPQESEADLFGPADDEPGTDDMFGPVDEEPAADDDLFGPADDEPEDNGAFGDMFGPADDSVDTDDLFGPADDEPVDDMFGPADEEPAAADDLFGPADNGGDLFGDPAENTDDSDDSSLEDLFGPPDNGSDDSTDGLFDDPFGSILRERGGIESSDMRQWVDNTGGFSCEGRLVQLLDGKVRLLKVNGRTTTVPLARLSRGDLDFVNRQASAFQANEISKTADSSSPAAWPAN